MRRTSGRSTWSGSQGRVVKELLGTVSGEHLGGPARVKEPALGRSEERGLGRVQRFAGRLGTLQRRGQHLVGRQQDLLGRAQEGVEICSHGGRPLAGGARQRGLVHLSFVLQFDGSVLPLGDLCLLTGHQADEKHALLLLSHLLLLKTTFKSAPLPFQLSDFQLKLFDFLFQLGLFQQNAAPDHQTFGVRQLCMKILTLQN